ncbi:MAG: CoA transferase [Deltaproteobacteria bacterium]|nr:CoA transferase [Deltaproteobacteria bacterium]
MNALRRLTLLSLEQATVLPYLTYRLAQDGVRVIRLEHPQMGDPNRKVGEPFAPGESEMGSYFLSINAGKEAVTLNLKNPKGQQLLQDLIVRLNVDVFATNQLPKNYASLGIEYETLRAVKPDLIWLGLTGFGPDSNEAAYDPVLQARGGLMDLTGEAGGSPQVAGIPLPDMGTSEHAYGLLMRALFERSVTGKGSRLDLAMMDSTVSWLTQPITMAKSFGKIMTRRGATHEFFAPVSVYPTKDSYVYVALGNDVQWTRLLSIPGFQGLDDPAYATNAGRIADVERLNERMAEATRAYATQELLDIFRQAVIPISKVQNVLEVCEDPAVKPKLLRAADPTTGFRLTLAPPPFMTSYLTENHQTLSFPPRFGEHNAVIYGETLGLGEGDLAALKSEGVI